MAEQEPAVERDAETVALFVEESLEGLQQVEQILLAAERGEQSADMMGTLFRAVHTMKGTAGYLAFMQTQALAHAAEDLLSRLRDKKMNAEPKHFGILVAVGDQLRRLVENVRETGDEGTADVAPLVSQIRAALQPPGAEPVLAQTAPPPQTPPQATTPAVAVPAADAQIEAVIAAPIAAASKEASAGKGDPADGTVRVNVTVLDRLMNLIGELVLARNQIVQTVKFASTGSASTQGVFQRLNLVTSELQEQVMKTRMQPVARVFEKIPRIVRDVARVTNKQVGTQIEGNATEIDKALVEAIRDPVMHIVRNAIDHGIEAPEVRRAAGKPAMGTLSVRAAHKGGAVTIEVEDDGKGMDPAFMRAHAQKKGILTAAEAAKLSDREAVELVFRPGFSTAAAVTDISGRGVGMDVVRTHVEKAGGQAEIESVPGRGTVIRLKMPLTLAIIPALLVRARGQRFAIPQVNLLELVYLAPEQQKTAIAHVRGTVIHRLRGEILPVVSLREVLGMAPRDALEGDGGINIVVLSVGSRRYSLVVDEIDNTEEIVIKPLRGQLKKLLCYSGATVLGDGGVAVILDAAGIASKSGLNLSEVRREAAAAHVETGQGLETLLVFSLAGDVPCAVPLAMVARLELIDPSAIETVGTAELIQYRGKILPIVRPEKILGLHGQPGKKSEQLLIVFDFGQRVAMAVDQIADIAKVAVQSDSLRQKSQFASGKMIINGRATLLLDVYQIMRELAPQFATDPNRLSYRGRVLVVESSTAMRTALASYLAPAGIEMKGVTSLDCVLDELGATATKAYGALVVDGDNASEDDKDLVRGLTQRWPSLPVFLWSMQRPQQPDAGWAQAGIRASFDKLQREELLLALEQAGVGSGPQDGGDSRAK